MIYIIGRVLVEFGSWEKYLEAVFEREMEMRRAACAKESRRLMTE